jgi:FAD:protein FMN transferase
MRVTRLLMGMPITVHVVGTADMTPLELVYDYFAAIDRRFSTYRADSEITALNEGRLSDGAYSSEMREVLALAAATKQQTGGYFDIHTDSGRIDPSGIVKGWAIRNAAQLLAEAGFRDYFIEAGGDIQSAGCNDGGRPWSVGIRNPFNQKEIIKVVYPFGRGVATSGTYVRGQHIHNPRARGAPIDDIISLTVIGRDILEADRFATAAFAMGRDGIAFIERTPNLEGYLVDRAGRATLTSGFDAYGTS